MNSYNSFNELAAASCSGPLQSQMSVFNAVVPDLKSRLDALFPLYDKYCDEAIKLKKMIDSVVKEKPHAKDDPHMAFVDFQWDAEATPEMKSQLKKIEQSYGAIDKAIEDAGQWLKQNESQLSTKDIKETLREFNRQTDGSHCPIPERYESKIPYDDANTPLYYSVGDSAAFNPYSYS